MVKSPHSVIHRLDCEFDALPEASDEEDRLERVAIASRWIPLFLCVYMRLIKNMLKSVYVDNTQIRRSLRRIRQTHGLKASESPTRMPASLAYRSLCAT